MHILKQQSSKKVLLMEFSFFHCKSPNINALPWPRAGSDTGDLLRKTEMGGGDTAAAASLQNGHRGGKWQKLWIQETGTSAE